MKSKRWKAFWIVCGILAAVGIVLAVAGTILGGFGILRSREDENIIRRWLNRIGITNEVTVSSELDNIDDLGDIGFFTDSEYVPGEVNGDTVTDFYGINELDIELAGMGVYVLPYDGDSIIVDTLYCRDDLRKRIHVWQEDTELKVEMEDGGRLTTENSGVMYISVPRGTYFQKISADAQAGFIEMTEVEADQMLASAGAGQVVLTSFSVRSLDKTTPRLIQFHTFKNAVNPPFLGGFSIFGTVAAEAEQRSCQRDSLFSMILCNDRKAIVTE